MAKLARVTYTQFGKSGSTGNFTKFGSTVNPGPATPVYTKGIFDIQNDSAWVNGWQSAVYDSNKAPFLEDVNAWCLVHAYEMAYLFQEGIPEWDAGTTYPKDAVVKGAAGGASAGQWFQSLQDNNLNNAPPASASNSLWAWVNSPGVPSGAMMDWPGLTAPAGWIFCGQTVSRVTYANIFNVLTLQTTGRISSGSPIITLIPSTALLFPGCPLSGVGIPAGAAILTVDNGTQVTMTMPATALNPAAALVFAPYGVGDGFTTFDLPNTPGRAPVGGGAGAGLTVRYLGQKGGEEAHVLTTPEIPAHSHTIASGQFATPANGSGGNLGGSYGGNPTAAGVTTNTGGGGGHNNMQPFIVLNKIIKI